MPKEKRPVDVEAWGLESGLPNDIDGFIRGAYFGFREKYQEVAGDSPMLILPLVSTDGEEYQGPAYSIGGGWKIAEGGKKVVHATRTRFVKTSMVGKLIERVTQELKVPMQEYGAPTDAGVWDGLGFHWVQEEHETVSKEKRTQLMPVSYLGEQEQAIAASAKPATGMTPELKAKLENIAKASADQKSFARTALKLPEVAGSDEILAQVLDGGPAGLYAQLK